MVFLSGITTAAVLKHLEKSREYRYSEEARIVYRTIELYLAENASELDFVEFYSNMCMYPLDNPSNRMYETLGKSCSPGAKVLRLSVKRDDLQLTALIYVVKGYRIEIRNGIVDEIKK